MHETRRLKPDRDAVILSGMLTAIQDFVKDSFKDETEWKLKEIEFGENRIFIERGDYVYIAVVYSGVDITTIQIAVQDALKIIEKRFWDTLETWDGDTQKLRGMRELLKPILRASADDLSGREEEFKQWEARLKEEQVRINSAIKDKEKEVESRLAELNELETTLRRKGEELRQKEGRLTELSEKSAKATEDIKHQWFSLQQKKQKELDDKIKELQLREAEMNQRVGELNNMESTLLDKESELKEKALLIETIKRELEGEMEKVRNRSSSMTGREKELKDSEARLSKLEEKLSADREVIEDEFAKIAQLKSELLVKINIVEARWKELQTTEEKMRTRETEMKKKDGIA